MPQLFSFILVTPVPPVAPVAVGGVAAALEGGFPFVDTGQVGVSGAFYPGDFTIDTTANPGSLIASASMGYMPGPGAVDYIGIGLAGSKLTNPGDYYVMEFNAAGMWSVVAASDGKETLALGNLPNRADVAHGFLALPSPFTSDGTFGGCYGFLHERSGVPGTFDLTTFPIRGLVDATNGLAPTLITTAVWENELGVVGADCRLVNVGFGPPAENAPQTTPFGYIVTRATSTLDPAQEAFFLKRFPETTSDPAVEIPIILAPTTTLLPDLSRFHVLAREDSTLVFYYKVVDSSTGLEGTAICAYDPIRGDAGGSFTTTGIKMTAALLFPNFIPAAGTAGAAQHPATGEILIALEDVQATNPLQKLVFAVSRGTGRLLDSIKFEIDSTNHSHFFGGRWASICTDFEATVNSIGWRNNFTGSSFSVVANYTPNAFSAAHHDFVNTVFNPTEVRPLIGEIAVRRDDEAADVGSVEVVGRNSTAFNPRETERQGYDADTDLYSVDLALKFDNVDLDTVTSAIGPPATTVETVNGPGVIGSSRVILDPSNSTITVDGSGASLDASTGLTVSFWFNPVEDAVGGFRTVASKLDGLGGTDWAIEWNAVGGAFRFVVVTIVATLTATALAADSPRGGYWTYITCVFDANDGANAVLRIYAFGNLIAETTGVIGNINAHAGTDLHIGYNGITDTPPFSVDDFWLKTDITTHQDVLALLAQAVSTAEGPAHNSHDPDICDRVMYTAATPYVAPEDGTGNPQLTSDAFVVTIREVNFQIGPSGYDRAILLDMWRRSKADEFTYLGSLPAPPGANNLLAGQRNNPRVGSVQDVPPRLLFESTAVTGTTYLLFFATYAAGANEQTIWRLLFEVEDKGLGATYTEVGNMDRTAAAETLSPGLDVIRDFNGDEVVFFGTRDTVTNIGQFRAAREADYGTALDLMPNVLVTAVVPNDSFTDQVARAPAEVAGQVVRTVVDGDGINKTAAGTSPQADDFQVFYGAYSRAGALEHILFGTYQVVFDGPELVNNGNLVARTDGTSNGARIDQPGTGLDPFVPISLQEPPPQLSAADPFRYDLLILANSGARATEDMQRGRSGLGLYKGRADGTNWKRTSVITHDPTLSEGGATHGADMALCASTLVDLNASAYTDANAEDYYLQISRPGPDGVDKTASLYLTANEALDARAVWDITTAGSIKPVIHPSFEPFVCVVEDYTINTRRWDATRTGPQIVKGSFTQAQPAPHWAEPMPGTLDPIDPAVTNIVPFQGQSFSPLQNVLRGWSQNVGGPGDYTQVFPAVMAPNFRTGAADGPRVVDTTSPLDVRQTQATHYRPVGIVDVTLTDEEADSIVPQSLVTGENGEKAGYGRYIALQDASGVVSFYTYDSFYFDEFDVNTIPAYAPAWRQAWNGTFDIPETAVNGMRSVTVQGRTFLYFIFGTTVSSRILVLELPSIIDILDTGATAQDPGIVADLSFVADDRIYAVVLPNDRVALYVGDAEGSPVRNTSCVVHDPIANETVRPEKVVVQGQTPFSRSYAATLARVDYNLEQVLIALEPGQSREGSGGQAYYGAPELGLGSELPTDLFDAGTGSIWNLVTFVTDGYYLFDTISVTPDDVKPYFGGLASTYFGSKIRRRTKPHFLARLTDPRISTDEETSTEIYMSAMYSEISPFIRGYGYHLNRITTIAVLGSGDPDASFGFGEDQPASGGLVSNYDGRENVYSTLVPIGFNIEYQGGVRDGDNYYAGLGGVAGLQLNWELEDDSTNRGKPQAAGGFDLVPLNYDIAFGAKILWMSPDVTLSVAWSQGSAINP